MRDDPTFETRFADALGTLRRPRAGDGRRSHRARGDRRRPNRQWRAERLASALGGAHGARADRRLRAAYVLSPVRSCWSPSSLPLAGGAFRTEAAPAPGPQRRRSSSRSRATTTRPPATHLIEPRWTGRSPDRSGRCPTYSRDGACSRAVLRGVGVPRCRSAPTGHRPGRSCSSRAAPAVGGICPVARWDPRRLVQATSPDSVELWVAPLDRRCGRPHPAGVDASRANYASPVVVTRRPPPRLRELRHGPRPPASTRRSAIDVIARRRIGSAPLDDPARAPRGRDVVVTRRPTDRLRRSARCSRFHAGHRPGAPSAYPPRDMFVIGADGTGERRSDHTRQLPDEPEWSPDGAILAFETVCRRSGPPPDHDAHGRIDARRRSPVLGPESEWFVWSPDGAAVALARARPSTPRRYRTHPPLDRSGLPRAARRHCRAVDGRIVCTPSWQRLEP